MSEEITDWLKKWNEGDQEAVDRVTSELAEELKRMAASYMKAERQNHTLQPTALVNELYLRLVQRNKVEWTDRNHFFAFAARTLRRILVDHARKHKAEKRGGDESDVTLEDNFALTEQKGVDILDLNVALDALAEEDSRLAQIVEMRFFAGLTIEETAAVMNIGTATVKRDLKAARAFLLYRLRQKTDA